VEDVNIKDRQTNHGFLQQNLQYKGQFGAFLSKQCSLSAKYTPSCEDDTGRLRRVAFFQAESGPIFRLDQTEEDVSVDVDVDVDS
jgi:hypothetical protein